MHCLTVQEGRPKALYQWQEVIWNDKEEPIFQPVITAEELAVFILITQNKERKSCKWQLQQSDLLQ